MREFKWTIEYTLSLSFPIFLELSGMLSRVRKDASVSEFYQPYGAVKYGGDASKIFFKETGFYKEQTIETVKYSQETLNRVLERIQNSINQSKVK